MSNRSLSAVAAVAAVAVVAALAFSPAAMAAQGMARDDYKAARKSIDADYPTTRVPGRAATQ